jgi:hypothetical protein
MPDPEGRRWPIIASIATAIAVGACSDALSIEEAPIDPLLQFSTGCPICDDTITDAEWAQTQNALDLRACDKITD